MQEKIKELFGYRDLIINGSLSFVEFKSYLEKVNATLRGKNIGEEDTGVRVQGMRVTDMVSLPYNLQLDVLQQYYQSLSKIDDNQEKAALSYYVLNDLHLFGDGNGRISRFMYQLFDNSFDINYLIHDCTNEQIKGCSEFLEEKNIEDIEVVNKFSNYILFKHLIDYGAISYDPRLEEYDEVKTFGNAFVTAHGLSCISKQVQDELGDENFARIQYNLTNDDNDYFTVSGVAMCVMLSKYGKLSETLDKNDEYQSKNPFINFNSYKRLVFTLQDTDVKKAIVDVSTWNADMCNEFSDICENVHKQQIETILDIFVNPSHHMDSQNRPWLYNLIHNPNAEISEMLTTNTQDTLLSNDKKDEAKK